jgi:hypothetical protein
MLSLSRLSLRLPASAQPSTWRLYYLEILFLVGFDISLSEVNKMERNKSRSQMVPEFWGVPISVEQGKSFSEDLYFAIFEARRNKIACGLVYLQTLQLSTSSMSLLLLE